MIDSSRLSAKSTDPSCCGCCPSNLEGYVNSYSCFPYRISCLESLIHILPGVGTFTGGFTWWVTGKKIQQLLKEAGLPIDQGGLDPCLVNISDCLEQGCRKKPILEDVQLLERGEQPSFDEDQFLLLSAKRANRAFIAVLNAIGCSIIFALHINNQL